ncbi:uncharacterized protein LOC132758770 [Ruditapes philippinarum]|uniref:uncharacterized protein LOC132758770 n=1 Tax=Ruditapes philippinarum TaxID=129788 RepID=UPI00295A6798|nr:uncharacterized protein LOC132758770 [Ruditapes philippinarum]
MLDITKGERAHVKCTADSYPASNISWIEKTDKEDKIKKQCDYGQECVLDVNADVVSKQYFVCEIRYLQLSDNKTLIVNIYKSRKQRHMFNIGNVTFIGIIVGICSALVVIVAVMVFVIRNKRNNDQDQPSQERNRLRQRNPSRQQSQNESQNANIHIYNNIITDNEAVTRDQDNDASNYESLSDQRDADRVYSDLRSTEL